MEHDRRTARTRFDLESRVASPRAVTDEAILKYTRMQGVGQNTATSAALGPTRSDSISEAVRSTTGDGSPGPPSATATDGRPGRLRLPERGPGIDEGAGQPAIGGHDV
jgi:hypothetical protein